MTVSPSKEIGFDIISPLQDSSPCPSCGEKQINIVQMPTCSIHHAAIRCGVCDHFLGWAAKPEKQQQRHQQQVMINQLLKSSRLSQWEQNFLEGLKGKKISLKQQEILSLIEVKGGHD